MTNQEIQAWLATVPDSQMRFLSDAYNAEHKARQARAASVAKATLRAGDVCTTTGLRNTPDDTEVTIEEIRLTRAVVIDPKRPGRRVTVPLQCLVKKA